MAKHPSIETLRLRKQAIVNNSKDLDEIFPDSWVIDKSADEVGGDFLFVKRVDNKAIIAVIDSIGHSLEGVSGAISIYGMISQAVGMGMTDPGDIISEMHRIAFRTFKGEITCDLGIARWDFDIERLSYAGAKRRAYYTKKEDLLIIPSSRISVGQDRGDRHRISTHTIEMNKGSRLYMATDGAESQVNSKGSQLKQKGIKAWLRETSHLHLMDQEMAIREKISRYLDESEQNDDILIACIQF